MGVLWGRSGTIERDANDVKAGGALAYFYAGGTTTPLTVYSDADESTPHTAPVAAASTGRWPAVFVPYTTSYDVKVTTSSGTQLYYYTEIPNPDPIAASEDTVDEAELFSTGDWKFRTTTGTLSGFVRANGRTIGSASSGATERANADVEDLYSHLWNGHANGILAVSTGRGATAAADFAANKTIALPDCRSALPMGVDDMGNSALGAGYGGSYTTGDATTGGSVGGANTHTLATGELPSHTHAVSGSTTSAGSHTHVASVTDPGHVHGVAPSGVKGGTSDAGTQTGASFTSAASPSAISVSSNTTGISVSNDTASNHSHSVNFTSGSAGSGTAHNNMSRHILGTWYIKL